MNIMFSLCWLDEPWRVERNHDWLKYHIAIKEELGYDLIYFVDNASSPEHLKQFEQYKDLVIHRYEEHIPRTGVWEIPYCWRGLVHVQKEIIPKYNPDKIIFLDSDCYILTSKFAKHIKELNTGWETYWCNRHQFPEAALSILCKDSMDILLNYPIPSYTHYNNQMMEHLLPYTKVNKDFVGDRYGELQLEQIKEMDYYAQHHPTLKKLVYNL